MIDKEMCCCSTRKEDVKCEYNPECSFLKEVLFLRSYINEVLQSNEDILKELHKYSQNGDFQWQKKI